MVACQFCGTLMREPYGWRWVWTKKQPTKPVAWACPLCPGDQLSLIDMLTQPTEQL